MACPQSHHKLVQGWVVNPGLWLTPVLWFPMMLSFGALPIIKILHPLSLTNSCKGDDIAEPLGPTW